MLMVLAAVYAIVSGNYGRALFPLFNGAFYVYGLVVFIGLHQSWTDALMMIRQRFTANRSADRLSASLALGGGKVGSQHFAPEAEQVVQAGQMTRSAVAN
jgi:hypothetical protein